VILRLRTTYTEASERKLERALMGKKIFIQNRMGSFIRTSGEINSGLGNWAADTCVSQVTSSFIQSTDLKDTRSLEWEDAEWQYLANALRSMEFPSHTIPVQERSQSPTRFTPSLNFSDLVTRARLVLFSSKNEQRRTYCIVFFLNT
jgi:hypothetical protein